MKTTGSKDLVKVDQILPIMQEYFGKSMNLARIKLMAYMLHALCVVQTVSLHKLASAMPTIPELQILICFNRPEDGVATYKKRWEIETAFRAMKSSGFNIEDTHLRDRERIARLFAMVCMALVWAYLVGEHKDIYVKPIKILKHGRRAKSLVK